MDNLHAPAISVVCPKMKRNKFPPKFAIANGFVIGSMPQVLQWTTTDGEKKVGSLLNMS
jgi:hypothetical protein